MREDDDAEADNVMKETDDGVNSQGVEEDQARCSMGEVCSLPMTSTPRQQPNQTSTSFKAQEFSQTFSQNSFNNSSQNVGSLPLKCDHCGFIGHFANHLRESPPCIRAYRSRPEFDVQGNDEEFVVRLCILTKNCPSPECPGVTSPRSPAQAHMCNVQGHNSSRVHPFL